MRYSYFLQFLLLFADRVIGKVISIDTPLPQLEALLIYQANASPFFFMQLAFSAQ